MAVQAAWWCSQAETAGVPLVFASRHGDVQRSFELLEQMARDEPMSPTHFGLSTHNAVIAQYSIARGLTGNYLATAAGVVGGGAAIMTAVPEAYYAYAGLHVSALALTLPAAVALMAIATPLTSVLYERGAFGAQDTAATALALAIYGATVALGAVSARVRAGSGMARSANAGADSSAPAGMGQ